MKLEEEVKQEWWEQNNNCHPVWGPAFLRRVIKQQLCTTRHIWPRALYMEGDQKWDSFSCVGDRSNAIFSGNEHDQVNV